MPTHVSLMGPGSYEPDKVLAGVLPRSSLTTLSGNQVITTGTTIDGKEITGKINVNTGDTVILENCLIRGDPTETDSYGIVTCTHSSVTDLRLINCSIIPSTPTKYMTGILGHHFTATRCLIRNCVDGIGVFNSTSGQEDQPTGVIIQQCWIGDHCWWADAPFQSDGSHCDGIQIQGGSDTIIRWNKFHAYIDTNFGDSPWGEEDDPYHRAMSGTMYSPNVGDITDTEVYGNWISGGQIGCNVVSDELVGLFTGTWTNNVFDDDQYHEDHAIDFRTGCLYSASGNIWRGNGPITIREY